MRRAVLFVAALAVAVGLAAACAAGAEPSPLTFTSDHGARQQMQRRSDALALSAQVQVPLLRVSQSPIDGYTELTGTGKWWDGTVWNPASSGTNVDQGVVTVTWKNAGDDVLRTDSVYVDGYVMLPGELDITPFHMRHIAPPAGAVTSERVAFGQSTAQNRVPLTMSLLGSGVSTNPSTLGVRFWQVRMTNHTAGTVVGAFPVAWETRDYVQPNVVDFWCTARPGHAYQTRLAPGESVVVTVWAVRPTVGGGTQWFPHTRPEAVAAPPADTVWRFYNKQTGTHFYTVDIAERDNVIATLAWLYDFEGPSYMAYATEQLSTTPLYRFYNRRNGTHFFTAEAAERDNVIATLSDTYAYEGIGYFIADSGGLATGQVFRFYNRRIGAHFYTADAVERDSVIANLGWLYDYNGPAFNVPK